MRSVFAVHQLLRCGPVCWRRFSVLLKHATPARARRRCAAARVACGVASLTCGEGQDEKWLDGARLLRSLLPLARHGCAYTPPRPASEHVHSAGRTCARLYAADAFGKHCLRPMVCRLACAAGRPVCRRISAATPVIERKQRCCSSRTTGSGSVSATRVSAQQHGRGPRARALHGHASRQRGHGRGHKASYQRQDG